jgi:hypothetical protein
VPPLREVLPLLCRAAVRCCCGECCAAHSLRTHCTRVPPRCVAVAEPISCSREVAPVAPAAVPCRGGVHGRSMHTLRRGVEGIGYSSYSLRVRIVELRVRILVFRVRSIELRGTDIHRRGPSKGTDIRTGGLAMPLCPLALRRFASFTADIHGSAARLSPNPRNKCAQTPPARLFCSIPAARQRSVRWAGRRSLLIVRGGESPT